MKFTIITVTYNCVKTIERTIRSVINQTYQNTDYIIIDGASNDGTIWVIEKYSDYLKYYISEPDAGIYYAMNKGIEAAEDSYILFLNGDDYFYHERVLERVRRHIADDKEQIYIGRIIQNERVSDLVDMGKLATPYHGVFYPHQATFVPKSFFVELGGFDTSYRISSDLEWIYRAIYNKYVPKWIDEIVSYYSTGGLSSSFQCTIDGYCIGKKYMTLSNDSNLDDMTRDVIEQAKMYFLMQMIEDEEYSDCIKEYFWQRGLKKFDHICIWGAGFWAEYFIKMMKICGIQIERIYDKNYEKSVCGIKVLKYEGQRDGKILISTERYDDEISGYLSSQGLSNGIDYLTFHSIRDGIIHGFNINDARYASFTEQTEIKLVI